MAELITVAQARERFKLTRYKMTAIIKDKLIPTYVNPRDARSTLIDPRDLEKLFAQPKQKAEATP